MNEGNAKRVQSGSVLAGGSDLLRASEKPFRTGATQAKKTQAEQKEMIEKQRQKDELELAEAEADIARRKNLKRSGGRSMLVKTSDTGARSTNLGGTV